VETVSGNMYITLQNKNDYRKMTSLDSTRMLYTALETSEHVYTECAAKHWAEQNVPSLDENAVTHSVLLGSKNVRKGGALIFQFLIRAILSGLEHFRHFSIDREYIVVQLEMF
jgi:hypothetical protein